jgi:hypothetical protein
MSARKKASMGMMWRPFGQSTWAKYSSRLKLKDPALKER